MKKCAVLFSGGKDSCMAAYLAKQKGYELACLISIYSQNKESYMFHTPSIKRTKQQAKAMEIPLIVQKTKGKKEEELKDLEKAIKKAKDKFGIEVIITGAIKSVYQASRIQKICDELNLECFNPLWNKDELEYLNDLINAKFKVIIVGVAAFPLNKSWLGREINKTFIEEARKLNREYQIHLAGEGGEFETFVLDCPLFKKPLEVKSFKDFKEGEYTWRREVKIA
ncbi:diphthine--ammonia ligase [Candidatus Pacearchaeota archaeon]|nr:diphthine--ammonia ligase [Candidatus Pacearchaeota archaeon]